MARKRYPSDGNYQKGKQGTSTWVNSRLLKQNKTVIREANAASRSRGLIKARITALTAKVSLMESEISSIMEALNIKSDIQVVSDKKAIQSKLLKAAVVLPRIPKAYLNFSKVTPLSRVPSIFRLVVIAVRLPNVLNVNVFCPCWTCFILPPGIVHLVFLLHKLSLVLRAIWDRR